MECKSNKRTKMSFGKLINLMQLLRLKVIKYCLPNILCVLWKLGRSKCILLTEISFKYNRLIYKWKNKIIYRES